MDDNSNNIPLFEQEFCLKQKLCFRAHVSIEAESVRKQKYAVIILLTRVLFRVNLITYVVQFLIKRESRHVVVKFTCKVKMWRLQTYGVSMQKGLHHPVEC